MPKYAVPQLVVAV